MADGKIDAARHRFPYCVVWTPLPCITWLLPFIGHMGIAMSSGVIRDFAGPYFVSEDDMAFGWPVKYWRLDPALAQGGASGWDSGVSEASHEYGGRMHNLFCDNCHSHVANALNRMNYDGRNNWNMFSVTFEILVKGRYVGFGGFVKTWLPCVILFAVLIVLILLGTGHI